MDMDTRGFQNHCGGSLAREYSSFAQLSICRKIMPSQSQTKELEIDRHPAQNLEIAR